jgi:hypothetical protein
MMRWGSCRGSPSQKLNSRNFLTINAKSDRLMESKIWREPFAKRRCLVPASGLYEWPKEGKAISQFYDEVPVERKESFGVGPFCPTRHAPPRMITVSPPAITQPHAGNTPVVELVYCPAVQRKRISLKAQCWLIPVSW